MKMLWPVVLALAACKGDPKPATVGSGAEPAGSAAGSAPAPVTGEACLPAIAAALAKVPPERWRATETIAPAEPPLLLVAEAVAYDPKTGAIHNKAMRGWMLQRGVAAGNACKEGAAVPTVVVAEATECARDGEPARHEGSGKVINIYPQRCAGTFLWVQLSDGKVLAQASGEGTGSAADVAQRELHAAIDKLVTPWTADAPR